MTTFPSSRRNMRTHATRAMAQMRMLVTLVIVAAVLVAVIVPVYRHLQKKAGKAAALDRMRIVGGQVANYAAQHDGVLPAEDTEGKDDWHGVAQPKAKEAWYNALPRLAGRKGAADYAGATADFYKEENVLYLPGANYPDKKKFLEPMFAYAFNTKLSRSDLSGTKVPTRLDAITQPTRTVLLLEQGLLNEDRTLEIQSRRDYDGAPKGSAKSFVGRYDGQGVLFFADGHAELTPAAGLLTETGRFPFPQGNVVWTRTPEEDPNKSDEEAQAKKKASGKK